MAATKDLVIQQGDTFSLVLRWETTPIVYKPITGISIDFGAPRLTVASHGLLDGWRATVTRVKGMTNINAENTPPRDKDYHAGTVIDADTIEFNDVIPVDDNDREWPAYISGGFIQYYTPHDLSGYSARMKVKDRIGGDVILSTEDEDSPRDILSITLDNTAKTITLTIDATNAVDFISFRGVYDLEMVSGDATPIVTKLISGRISFPKEVTT